MKVSETDVVCQEEMFDSLSFSSGVGFSKFLFFLLLFKVIILFTSFYQNKFD
jgi:hypothetical protein